jgi:DNA-binding PadR family transcriptional regulator
MRISNTETALLVLLSEGPAHPYHIEKMIADRSMDEWSELSRSTIYKTLVRLESKGFARSDSSLTERNVGRKTYSLTDEGRAVLEETLLEFLSAPERCLWRIDLATSHLGLLDTTKVEAALARYAHELELLIDGYARLEEYLVGASCPEHALALARRPRALFRAEMEWLAEYRREVADGLARDLPGGGAGDGAAGGTNPDTSAPY